MKLDEVTYIGHACFTFETSHTLFISDPWVSKGAFLKSWLCYPEASSGELIAKINNACSTDKPTIIWISHEHSDHFDLNFLKCICNDSICKKNITIILPRFPGSNLAKQCDGLGCNLIEIGHKEKVGFNDITLQMFLEKPLFSEHSSIVYSSATLKAFHNSDSSLQLKDIQYIKNNFDIDLYIGQFAGSSPFPHVMNWNDSKKLPLIEEHEHWATNRFKSVYELVEPKVGIMAAGPALITNTNNSSPPDIHDLLLKKEEFVCSENLIIPYPGQKFNSKLQTSDIFYMQNIAIQNWDKYRSDFIHYRKDFYHDFDTNLGKNVCNGVSEFPPGYIKKLKKLASLVNYLDHTVCFEIKIGEDYQYQHFKFKEGIFEYHLKYNEANENTQRFNKITIDHKFMNLFLSGQIIWDEIGYSRNYQVTQSDDGYCPLFIQALRTIHNDTLFSDFLKSCNNKSIQRLKLDYINQDGSPGTAHIKSKCPHQGYSLEGIKACGEYLTCPMHGHTYNLKNGNCINKSVIENILMSE